MYKMIALDIDDTLLNDDLQITPETHEALKQAIEQGIIVTLATGRMFASAKQVAQQLALDVPLITYQGAYVRTLRDETLFYERTVPSDAAQKLFEYTEKHHLHLQLYWNDTLYVKEDNEKVRHYVGVSGVSYVVEPDFQSIIDKPLIKMLIFEEAELLDRITPELRELLGDQVHITKSKPVYLEFMHAEATKGHALAALAQHYNCSMEQVIGVGDAWNDRELISMSGLGVAMGNAIDELKEIADFVTKTNNEDGIKHVLDTYVFNR